MRRQHAFGQSSISPRSFRSPRVARRKWPVRWFGCQSGKRSVPYALVLLRWREEHDRRCFGLPLYPLVHFGWREEGDWQGGIVPVVHPFCFSLGWRYWQSRCLRSLTILALRAPSYISRYSTWHRGTWHVGAVGFAVASGRVCVLDRWYRGWRGPGCGSRRHFAVCRSTGSSGRYGPISNVDATGRLQHKTKSGQRLSWLV
ncbi:hypothetical protein F4780DRAFT_19432 [Xylariomycetidae sp. FL0641]|nr:hypothetical protein F4780DRAFT_19432 [Xylariomycetidae sp. FL0641]